MGHLSLVKPLSQLLEEQKYPDEVSLDAVGIAFTRGTISEISGEKSSGKTGLALALLARLTASGEICAAVDASGGFDPSTAYLAGVELENLLWVRCQNDIEKAFIAADLLVQAKGFGAVWLDLSGLPIKKLRLVPKTYWYRYRTRIKETPTIFMVTSREPVTGSASQQAFTFSRERSVWSGSGSFKLLREFHISGIVRKGPFGAPIKARIEVDYSEI